MGIKPAKSTPHGILVKHGIWHKLGWLIEAGIALHPCGYCWEGDGGGRAALERVSKGRRDLEALNEMPGTKLVLEPA